MSKRNRNRIKKMGRRVYSRDGFYRYIERKDRRNKSALEWAQLLPFYYDYVTPEYVAAYILKTWGIRVAGREAEDICYWLPCDPDGDCM